MDLRSTSRVVETLTHSLFIGLPPPVEIRNEILKKTPLVWPRIWQNFQVFSQKWGKPIENKRTSVLFTCCHGVVSQFKPSFGGFSLDNEKLNGNFLMDKLSPQKHSVATLPVNTNIGRLEKTQPILVDVFSFFVLETSKNSEFSIAIFSWSLESMCSKLGAPQKKPSAKNCPLSLTHPSQTSFASRFITDFLNLPALQSESCCCRFVLEGNGCGLGNGYLPYFFFVSPMWNGIHRKNGEKPTTLSRFPFNFCTLRLAVQQIGWACADSWNFHQKIGNSSSKQRKQANISWIFQFAATRWHFFPWKFPPKHPTWPPTSSKCPVVLNDF